MTTKPLKSNKTVFNHGERMHLSLKHKVRMMKEDDGEVKKRIQS